MAFATMKQTPWNVLMMGWIAADPMLLLIIALNVLVMVSKYLETFVTMECKPLAKPNSIALEII